MYITEEECTDVENDNIDTDTEDGDMLRFFEEKVEDFDGKVSGFLDNINKSRYDDDGGNESVENLDIIIKEEDIMEQEIRTRKKRRCWYWSRKI